MEDYRVETWMIHLTETEGKAQEGPFLYVGLPTPPKRWARASQTQPDLSDSFYFL